MGVPGSASPRRWHYRAAEPGVVAVLQRGLAEDTYRSASSIPCFSGGKARCSTDKIRIYPGIKFMRTEEPLVGHLFRIVMIL